MPESEALPTTLTDLSYVLDWQTGGKNPASAARTIITNNEPADINAALALQHVTQEQLEADSRDKSVNDTWAAVIRPLRKAIMRHFEVRPGGVILHQAEEDGLLDDYVVSEPVDLTKVSGDKIGELLTRINILADPTVKQGVVNHLNARLRQTQAPARLADLAAEHQLAKDVRNDSYRLTRKYRVAGAVAGSMLGLLLGLGAAQVANEKAFHAEHAKHPTASEQLIAKYGNDNLETDISLSLVSAALVGVFGFMVGDPRNDTRMRRAHQEAQRRAKRVPTSI